MNQQHEPLGSQKLNPFACYHIGLTDILIILWFGIPGCNLEDMVNYVYVVITMEICQCYSLHFKLLFLFILSAGLLNQLSFFFFCYLLKMHCHCLPFLHHTTGALLGSW